MSLNCIGYFTPKLHYIIDAIIRISKQLLTNCSEKGLSVGYFSSNLIEHLLDNEIILIC